ncbi:MULTISPECIES: acyl carrier protein [Paraburkholderia]|jgi:acyl carrier protein|uniref:Acyl carrier protein n=1 Tax=Paraburkholderia madseniana TaxID=2599607 RepID=A0A6N6W218_9BURK|nr:MULTISPECIES: acyl carrier protein [Paraburkholderia]KAE8754697.1 acyl carrier protein [Paraburkholderia madseniana]MCX4175352.1 acyl carrier protein [Paraburkholderia madseniana]MDQ6463350.1 acyl carrier protein [Paraburkholderia madseniana]NPT67629.1 acyl carrier protein [Paraburkholderia madseniana]
MKNHMRGLLQEIACLDVPVDALGDRDDLYAAGLSSLGSVRLMMAIEETFAIEIPAALITHDLFQSIDSLARVIAHLVPEESLAPRT